MGKCIDCYKTCGYFPNTDLNSEDYYYDEQLHANRRKNSVQLKCLYDYTNIKWDRTCPKVERENA